MGSDCGIELRVSGAKNHGHRSPGGHPRYEDATLINPIARRDFACDAGNERRLTAFSALIFRSEPIPALRSVRICALGRIHNHETVLLGERVHLRARCKIVWGLRTA